MDNELIQSLKHCGAVKLGDFTLASGKKSDYYIDIKKAISTPATLKLIERKIVDQIKTQGLNIGAVGGVAIGGIPLATAVSLALDLPLVIIRNSTKEYGTKDRLIGDVSGKNLLIVEDVTTTGTSVIEAVKTLRDKEAIVDTVITVVDRDEGASDGLNTISIKLIPLVKAADLLIR